MIITERNINYLYSLLKKNAHKSFLSRKYFNSLKYWEVAALTAYNFFLPIRDDEIEDGLSSYSGLIHKRTITSIDINSCVFYDAHSFARGGLTQQYIRAIIAAGWKMVYITEVSKTKNTFQPILEELELANNAEIRYIPQDIKGLERIQYIYDTIIDTQAKRLFMHIVPTSVCAVAAFDALPKEIEKYQINFTDHTFWVGHHCLDYCLEFRKYGCTQSVVKRGIAPERVLLLPVYTIETETPFSGFPFERKERIVVFSGGAYYKTIDEKDTYFKLCKEILTIDQRVIIAYAGYGDEEMMKSKIAEYNLTGKFILLGFRKDMSAIFDNIDIYLDTYPLSGGLMCQYAARHSVPILSINGWKVEDIVCQRKLAQISSENINDLIVKAKKLINDITFRQNEGKRMADCCITVDSFNEAFRNTIESNKSQFDYEIKQEFQEYSYDRNAKIKFENETKSFHRTFIKHLGLTRTLIEFPSFVYDSFLMIVKEKRFLSIVRKIV